MSTNEFLRSAYELRENLWKDRHRPRYHFLPPAGWMNDINGVIHWNGRYHVFYQHDPYSARPGAKHWGHASSVDLVHWVHHPVALTPTPDGPDGDGCHSGMAVVNGDLPTIVYSGVPGGTCLATASDEYLIEWAKHPDNPVIPVPERGDPDFGKYIVHDPCAWKREETWYALSNRKRPDGQGDTAFLFRSSDLIHWEYLHPFYDSNRRWTKNDEDCAVPSFFPIGKKHMLLFASHLVGTQYYLGRYEGERFYPENHGRMSWAGGLLAGCIAMNDGSDRRLFFDWIGEARDAEAQASSGWSGAMTLPRVLSLHEDDELRIEPAPELQVLRAGHRKQTDIEVSTDSDVSLDDIRGDCIEMAIEIEPRSAVEFGVKVRCSPDGKEQTVVGYDAETARLKIDVGRSTLDESIQYLHFRDTNAGKRRLGAMPERERTCTVQKAPFELRSGENLELRIFLDRSVIEVFANRRQCVTHRIYPVRGDSLGVRLFTASGGVNVKSVEAWDMAWANGP